MRDEKHRQIYCYSAATIPDLSVPLARASPTFVGYLAYLDTTPFVVRIMD